MKNGEKPLTFAGVWIKLKLIEEWKYRRVQLTREEYREERRTV